MARFPSALTLTTLLATGVAGASQIPTDPDQAFTVFCVVCHGQDGRGQIDNPAIETEPMDFTDCSITTPEPDSDWELVITHGGPAAGLSSEMPSFGDALEDEQIQALIGRVRDFCAEDGWPLGNLNFPRPMFTEKSFPENEFVLLPDMAQGAGEDYGFGLRAIFERRVGKRGHAEVRFPVESVAAAGERRSGLGDIQVAGKYVLHTDRAATRITATGLEISLPTGDEEDRLGKGTTVFEPYLAFGTRVRDVYLQTQVKVELPAGDPVSAAKLDYNVFVGRDLTETLDTWTVGVELNGVDDDLAVTPQVRKGLTRTGALALAVGVQYPLNHRRDRPTRWVGYLLWEYHDPVRAVKD